MSHNPMSDNPMSHNSMPHDSSSEKELSFKKSLPIINQRGLHARASAKFVKTAELFDAVILVEKDGSTVGGTSIMGLMMLAASKGTAIEVQIKGPQAKAAMEALESLVADKFGEEC